MSEPLRIAIAGLGTVGAGVIKMIRTHGDMLAARAGRPIEITAISARSRSKDRGVDISGYDWEDDPVVLARRSDIDVFVEVMGGEDGPAKASIEAALAAGHHVVTANKALLASHGQAMAELAESNGAALRFEAAVAGGIPVVKALTEGLAGNRISRVMGVLNGTCNYILTQMEETGAAYGEVLRDAQNLGYAEADPSFDVGGADAAQKLALLSATAFGCQVDYGAVKTEGIERVSLTDIEHAADMGYKIKLLGVAQATNGGIEQRMQPCLVPANSPFGQLPGVTNMVVIEGDFIGRTVYQGPGAGEGATASAVMGDVIDIARGLVIPAFGQPATSLSASKPAVDQSDSAYYVRLQLADKPGALAKVAEALGSADVSIDRMRQYGHTEPTAPVLIVTHRSPPDRVRQAISRIETLDVCADVPVAIRIEDI